eukprot:CAMPEP_0174909092 /NCGR_PEP_ID=MMETSP0167-20121228/67049_1 /TAXON_ID=38298 /ORGANISM="Rhodella maculata, Strain CCMP736" /LENGTH=55 /DNA_ID=CAMNT_0016152981 /DNA_START=1 /DNA_END=168 /DNA_ORIENTATION=+
MRSVETFGDELNEAVTWDAGSEEGNAAGVFVPGRQLQLTFTMTDADLYSWSICEG